MSVSNSRGIHSPMLSGKARNSHLSYDSSGGCSHPLCVGSQVHASSIRGFLPNLITVSHLTQDTQAFVERCWQIGPQPRTGRGKGRGKSQKASLQDSFDVLIWTRHFLNHFLT